MRDCNIVPYLPKPYSKTCTPYNTEDFSCETTSKVLAYSNHRPTTTFKVIVIGDVSVGKTCIVNRLCRNEFGCEHRATIGVDLDAETLTVLGWPVTLHIWDTSGTERFKSVVQSYYRGAHAIIIVFEFSCMNTLYHCETWLEEALENVQTKKKPIIFLVGNKMDIVSTAAYENTEEIAVITAAKLSAEYWPVCAKTGLNVECVFQRLTGLLFDTHFVKFYKPPVDEDSIKLVTRGHIKCFKKKSKKEKKRSQTLACGCFRS